MRHTMTFVGGMGIGAGLTYALAPGARRRRRARLADELQHGVHEATQGVERAARDLSHRSRGVVFSALGRLRRESVDDARLEQRVRSKLGRVCSHPGAIEVVARRGAVELHGKVLEREHDAILATVHDVRGVRGIVDGLERHARPGHEPSLQGGRVRGRPPAERWSPAVRLLAGAAGVALAGGAGKRLGLPNGPARLFGLSLVLQAVTNRGLVRLLGLRGGRRAVDVRKSIEIDAPVEEVFGLWSQLESFPRYMSHVKEVRRTDDGQYEWTVAGPAGLSIGWRAAVTSFVPERVIAWRSVEGEAIANAGILRFRPTPTGGTRLEIALSYNPPAGVVGHALAAALGAHPKRLIDDDLLRFKSLVEAGKATGRAGTVTRAEIEREAPQRL